MSALAFHEITEEVPNEVQIALPRHTKTPVLDHAPLRAFRFSKTTLTAGVEEVILDGVPLRVFGRRSPWPTAFASATRWESTSPWMR